MARYPRNSYGRRGQRNTNWFYIFLALVIFAAGIAFIFKYNPFETKTGPDNTASKQSKTVDKPKGSEVEKLEPEKIEISKPALPPQTSAEPDLKLADDPVLAKLLNDANDHLSSNPPRIIDARELLNKSLQMPMAAKLRTSVKSKLAELSEEWLFSRKIFPQDTLCDSYKVQRGDLLSKIGKKHKVPWEILADINRISRPEALGDGKTIKVINGPFHVTIDRSDFTMDLYLQKTYVKSYNIGIGMPGRETPTGLWRVQVDGKMEKPQWTDPDTGKKYEADDPNYPLGSRWIGLEGLEGEAKDRDGFAIHGTKNPEQIGTAGSRGCIRMHNGEVIEMYNLLMPGFSLVRIVE